MSDGTSDLTSAPDSTADAPESTSTASIAERVIESAEDRAHEPGDEAAPAPAAANVPRGTSEAAATPGVVQPPLSEEEQLLAEFGFKDARRPDGTEHRIARSKVLKMIASGLKRGQDKWATEKTGFETAAKDYQGRFETITPVLHALEQGPEAFLAEAGKHDPRYAQFLTSRAAPAAAPAPVDLPEPDFTLPDGSKTYTMKGIREGLVPFIMAQAEKVAQAKAEAALKPVTEREKAAAEARQADEATNALRERTRGTMKEAESWPLFGPLAADGSLNEVQTAVLEALRADTEAATAAKRRPTLTLEGAYIKVTSARLSQDDATKRAALLKEINAAAKASPTVARAGAEAVRAPAGLDTRAIAERNLARLDGGA